MNRKIITKCSRVKAHLVFLASFVAATLLMGPGWGAEDAAVMKLSLKDAISQALDVNPNLKQAEESQFASKSRLRVANIGTSFDVGTTATLASGAGQSDRSGRMFGEMTYANKAGTKMSLSLTPFTTGADRGAVGLTLRHPLMKGKGLFSDKSNSLIGAKLDVSIQEKQFYLARQSLVQSVISAYLRAVKAREEVKVQERALLTSQTAADGARKKAIERQITEIEVARAEILVAQTKDQLNIQKQDAQGALDALMVAIGEGVGKTPELTDTVPEIEPNTPTLADAVNKALQNRVELSVYDMQLSEQERLLSVKKNNLKPSMDVVAGFNSLDNDTGLISRSLLDLGAFTAGIEYRLPMDKRALQEDRDTTARDLDVLKRLRVYQMEQVAESVRNAYRGVEASKTSVEILGQNLKIAQDNVVLAQKMLDEGLDDNRNLLDGQQALTRAESGLLSAKVELYMSTINLKYAMG
ncbi:MAG: TolC family protein, partial [Armatimonadetes bacterium]|nr:TolC family protein [Armatimonadota bacterium]